MTTNMVVMKSHENQKCTTQHNYHTYFSRINPAIICVSFVCSFADYHLHCVCYVCNYVYVQAMMQCNPVVTVKPRPQI